jgi:hypothetical protein
VELDHIQTVVPHRVYFVLLGHIQILNLEHVFHAVQVHIQDMLLRPVPFVYPERTHQEQITLHAPHVHLERIRELIVQHVRYVLLVHMLAVVHLFVLHAQ